MATPPLILTSILSRLTDALCVSSERGVLLEATPIFFDLMQHQLPDLRRMRDGQEAAGGQHVIDDSARTREVLLRLIENARLPDGTVNDRAQPLDDDLLGPNWFVHVEHVVFTNGDAGYLISLESEQTELKKHRYERLISAIARCEHILLTEPMLQSAMGEAVDIIGAAAECDRCYIFQIHDAPTGEKLVSQRFEWVGAGIEPEIDNPMLQNMPWEMHEPLFNALARGEVMHGLVRESEDLFREQMTAQGILSYLFVPILVEGSFWGWIGYDDCTVERRWLSSEVTALFSLSSAIGTAIHKDALRRNLDEYNRRYKLILKTFGEVLWVWDAEHDVLSVSDEWRTLLHYEGMSWPSSIREWSEAVHPDDRDELRHGLAHFIEQRGETFNVEFRFRDGHGSYRWLVSRATRDGGIDGTSSMMIGVNVDITRQKETEALLKVREEQIRKIFTFTSDVAYSWDLLDPTRCEVICSGDNLFGRPVAELQSSTTRLEDHVHDDDRVLYAASVAQSLTTGILDVQYRIVLPDGEPRWVQNRGQVQYEDGTAIGLLGLIIDVDEIKRAELTVRAVNQQLEDRVRERTDELRRTNALLYEREQRSRILSELVSDYSYEFRVDEGVMYLESLTETFTSLTGHDVAALRTMRHEDLLGRIFHPADADVLMQHRETLLAGHPSSCEYRILRVDGSSIWVEGNARPIWNEAHTRIERVIGLSRDIDEKKQIQLSLEDSERKNRAIVEALPDMIFITDDTGVYLDFHARSRSELLRPDGSFLGRSMREVLPPDIADEYAGVLETVVRTGELEFYEYMLAMPHGKRYFEARVRPYGKGTYITIVRDITDRKVHEENILELNRTLEQRVEERTRALRTSEERYRLITQHSHDLIKIIDANDRCVYVSPSVTRILGYSQEEFIGISLRTLAADVADDDPGNSIDGVLERMGSGRPMVLQLRHRNGTLRSLEMIASRMVNEDGGDAGILIVSRDVTERERMTRELELALVREQELNELQRRFVATASHQFRTPLTVIQSGMELIEMIVESAPDALQSKLYRQTDRVKSEVVRMTDLMNDILILGRHSARKTAFAPEAVPFRDFLSDLVARNFSDRSDGRHVQLDDDAPAVVCWMDPKLIAHVLVNIISNAFKYATTGNPHVWYRSTDSHIRINVEDKGIGILPEDVQNLFQPFYRGSNAVQFQGTGLGLTIAKEFVDLHGGTIEVARGARRGSCFTIILPIHRSEHDTHSGH